MLFNHVITKCQANFKSGSLATMELYNPINSTFYTGGIFWNHPIGLWLISAWFKSLIAMDIRFRIIYENGTVIDTLEFK
ncbi:hypothetical protein LPTSP2_38210 [Leptospira ellinghausenii]|uniref:Uncharacterized protein n=1 Tax=Leptospira ellinghausenii TaxID=1917822 RepID=A0A2P2DIR4_9LEPT|nr:hypothetical protein [Leptospira ellinghausenii]GBF44518.1 hypothetical protein LPTSP2_38210 [Leptospira ellinghausenii]